MVAGGLLRLTSVEPLTWGGKDERDRSESLDDSERGSLNDHSKAREGNLVEEWRPGLSPEPGLQWRIHRAMVGGHGIRRHGRLRQGGGRHDQQPRGAANPAGQRQAGGGHARAIDSGWTGPLKGPVAAQFVIE